MVVHAHRQVESFIRGDPCDLVYRIDTNDRITFVDDHWTTFARNNGARELTPEVVLHHPLWRFLADGEIRSMYRALVDRVRRTERPLMVPLRCDAPGIKRVMELHLRPLGGGAVEFASRLRRAEHRHTLPLLDASAERAGKPLTICSWCKRIHLSNQIWVETDRAVRHLDLLQHKVQPPLEHTVCPFCREVFQMCFGSYEEEEPSGGRKARPHEGENSATLN